MRQVRWLMKATVEVVKQRYFWSLSETLVGEVRFASGDKDMYEYSTDYRTQCPSLHEWQLRELMPRPAFKS